MEQRGRVLPAVNRKKAIQVGGTLLGAALAGCAGGGAASGSADPILGVAGGSGTSAVGGNRLGVMMSGDAITYIQRIIQAQGTYQNNVLSIEIDRKDITDVTWRGHHIDPSFEINGSLTFQCLGGDDVYSNCDMALKPSEVDPFIDALLRNNIVFQAHHQHYYSFEPDVWFMHFRIRGTSNAVAHALKNALSVTSTPFPQTKPKNPTTPLPAEEMGKIIGASPNIGGNGVVSFNVPRKEAISLGGIRINPYLNVDTNIYFQPMGGQQALASPDYGMIASEINKVVGYMRARDWDSGCLYNQETAEEPQLYFDHLIKAGDALQLAREIRGGLDLMNVALK